MRVDTVPLWLAPFFLLLSYVLGSTLYFLGTFLPRLVCPVVLEPRDYDVLGQKRIYCIWHEDLIGAFIWLSAIKHQQVWMNHPMWYMKPIHVMLKLLGIRRIILGSTGHQGRDAADKLVQELSQGASTLVALDGPSGPVFQPKKGPVHMAYQSGAVLVPLKFGMERSLRLMGWDRKKFPLPFSKITLKVMGEMQIDHRENIDDVVERISEMLMVEGGH